MKGRLTYYLAMSAFLFLTIFTDPCAAYSWKVGERPLTVAGYITQEVDFGLVQNKYDTQSGFNSFLTSAMVEVSYMPTDETKLFASGSFQADWAYEIFGSGRNKQWEKKGFADSRSHQYIYGNGNDLLHEAHFTWSGEHFYLRVGKQIVQWGETDVWRLTNLINPVDTRRGVADVKFETTIVPIWMVRAEYNTKKVSFANELGVQFIFDPAFQYRGNLTVEPGNDYQGVFSPNVYFPSPFFPFYVGKLYEDIERPHDFDSRYFSYGLKVRADIGGTIVHLLGFYGRDRDYVSEAAAAPFFTGPNAFDGAFVMHPVNKAFYPYYKFVGATVAKEVESLSASVLGGVSPVFRIEALYAFNTVYAMQMGQSGTGLNTFMKTNEIALAVSADWKIKSDLLNPNAYISISPQFFFQRELNYPHLTGVVPTAKATNETNIYENDYKYSLMVMTSYFHNKLTPMFVWSHNQTLHDNMLMGKLSYAPNQTWSYSLSGIYFDGAKYHQGNNFMQNKDKIWANITYNFE